PAMCAGGGPPVSVDPGKGPKCAGSIAQTTFTWGVCSCKNALFSSDALVDGWDSTRGTYTPGKLGGGGGANGDIMVESAAQVWGQCWAASTATAFNASQLGVHHDLQSGGNILGALNVTRNAWVAGNIDAEMTVGMTLYQTPGKTHPQNLHP